MYLQVYGLQFSLLDKCLVSHNSFPRSYKSVKEGWMVMAIF